MHAMSEDDTRIVGPSDVLLAMRAGVDRRAILLSVIAQRPGFLHEMLQETGFLSESPVANPEEAFRRLRESLPFDVVSECARVSETSGSAVLVGLFGQLKRVADFVLSKEATQDVNLKAVSRLIKDGRVDLFLH